MTAVGETYIMDIQRNPLKLMLNVDALKHILEIGNENSSRRINLQLLRICPISWIRWTKE